MIGPVRFLGLQQTDTASACGTIQACSANGVAGTPIGRAALMGTAAPGTGTPQISVNASATSSAIFFDSGALPVGAIATGSWVVRLNVTTANMNLTWVATYICRTNNAAPCVSQATIASLTGQSVSVGATGVATMTVTQSSAATLSANDHIYITLDFTNGSTHSASTLNFTPNQIIDTPMGAAGSYGQDHPVVDRLEVVSY